MKNHPGSVTLIEKETNLWWRIVERHTTRTGFAREFDLVERGFPRLDVARDRRKELKKLAP